MIVMTPNHSLSFPKSEDLIRRLADENRRVVIVSSGGGSEAISHLATTPGVSEVMLEALVPYSRHSVDSFLGGKQETYCSSRAARRLAVLAWQRACFYGATCEQAVGVSVTASLKSIGTKKGDHRVVVALQTFDCTRVAYLTLQKNQRSRTEEEHLAAWLALESLVSVTHGNCSLAKELFPGESVDVDMMSAPLAWQELFTNSRRVVGVQTASPESTDSFAVEDPVASTTGRVIFSGSFDPLHEGHLLMARIAEEIAERPVDYELSVTNVDKPMLDYVAVRGRLMQFSGQRLWLTRAATFEEKLDIFPKSTFVMGADTFVRLSDPRYYGGSNAAAEQAVRRIAKDAAGLIVFGRVRGGNFEDPSQLNAPAALKNAAYFVSQREFRCDLSSTQLRQATARG